MADADEMNILNDEVIATEKERLQVLIKLEDDMDEVVVLDVDDNQVRFDLEDIDEETKLPLPPNDWKEKEIVRNKATNASILLT